MATDIQDILQSNLPPGPQGVQGTQGITGAGTQGTQGITAAREAYNASIPEVVV